MRSILCRRRLLAGATAALALGARAQATRAAAPAEVTIDNFTFVPPQISVAAGTPVRWTNRDDIPHTITDARNPPQFRSPPLDTDETFSVSFERAGTYHYFCSLHPHMQGTVVVR